MTSFGRRLKNRDRSKNDGDLLLCKLVASRKPEDGRLGRIESNKSNNIRPFHFKKIP